MKRLMVIAMVMLGVLAACDDGASTTSTSGANTGGVTPVAGYEVFDENGAVPRPTNAIEVYVGYSPEAQTYMPELIRRFNQSYADGKHPLTGAALAANERPIYVWGTQPVTGSSGTMAEGIFNAIAAPTNSNLYRPTIFIPSTSNWLEWVNFNSNRDVFNVAESSPIAPSPVILGIWEDRLQELERTTGKPREEIGWTDIMGVLQNGWQDGRKAVYYGHTDPRVSSTGLSTTIAEFYACARREGFSERRLTVDAVNDSDIQTCMRELQSLVRHYSRRTEDFLNYFGQGPDYLDMLALEEVDLICINQGAVQGDEQCLKPRGGQLVGLYPSEGIFYHERAASIVQLDASQGGWTTAEQREAAKVFIDHLLLPSSQELIVSFGFRAGNPSVPLTFPVVEENGIRLDLSDVPQLDTPSIETITAIQQSWALVKKQADVMILLDISGSMNDQDKIGQAKEAAKTFIESLESNNRVGLTVFSSGLTELVPLGLLEDNKQMMLDAIDGLFADGGTELFLAVTETVNKLNREDEGGRVRAVVLLSDGEDTGGQGYTLNDAVNAATASRDTLNPVILIPLAYGSNASVVQLNSLAAASKTEVLSGNPDNISSLLRLLSSYF